MNALSRVAASALLCASVTACSEIVEPVDDVPEPEVRYSAAPVTVSGSVVFTNGRTICNQFPSGFVHSLRIIRVVPDGPDVSVATPSMTCPNNSFSVSLEPGDYVVRGLSDAMVNPDSRFPRLPWAELSVDGAMSGVQIVFGNGGALGGRMTLDGEPLAGILVDFRPAATDITGFNFSSFAVTHADGTWGEHNGSGVATVRERVWLQPGVSYTTSCGTLGGAILDSSTPSPFVFGDVNAFNCRFRTSRAAAWTHLATALDVTAGPGTFGVDPIDDSGYGYGVQYPSTTPVRNLQAATSHMFDSSFLIAVDGAILSTSDVSGHLQCVSCRDFSPATARPKVVEGAGNTREILWNLTDGGSSESPGFAFQQRSFDGTGGDYVLFRLAVTNTSAVTRDFNFGFVADWDVAMSFSGSHSVGLNGNIAYSTRTGGPVVGSVFLGEYTRTFYGFPNQPSIDRSVAAQVGWLDGSINNTGAESNDVKYVHGVRDIRLRAGKTRVFWFALVAGADQAELAANAAAAEADMNARTGG